MPRLTQHQARRLLNCLGELYAHHDLDSFVAHSLVVASKAIAADYSTCTEMNLRRKRLAAFAYPKSVDLSAPVETQALMFRDHLPVKHLRQVGDVPALRISDFLTAREHHETAMYREAYRRLRVEYQMGCTLPSPTAKFSVALAFVRKRRNFSKENRLVLDLLRPHLFQAYRNAELVTQLNEQHTRTKQALQLLPQGIVILTALGRIGFCSPRAQQWLSTWFGRASCRNNRLPEPVQCWVRQQGTSPKNGGLPAPRQSYIVERDGRQLAIRLLGGSVPSQRTLIIEERRSELSAAPLRALGLTAREAEVLLWVAQGKTNREIGMILGLSAGTVHKHIEHIHEKLGVETRTAAGAQAWAVLRTQGD